MSFANPGAVQNIAAANTFTNPLRVDGQRFNVGVTGVFVGTITIQVLPPGGDPLNAAHWVDQESVTAPAVRSGHLLAGPYQVRAGFKTGAYTSGTAILSVYREL